jgi:1,6-anhydro-N-acetylmuramate kinase
MASKRIRRVTARELFVGLMSGTSLDGVDAALVEFAPRGPVLMDTAYLPFPGPLKTELQALQTQARTNWIVPRGPAMRYHACTPKRS